MKPVASTRPERDGKPWNKGELSQLVQLVEGRHAPHVIAQKLQRTTPDIRRKAAKMGLTL
jgi:hypothetical protein